MQWRLRILIAVLALACAASPVQAEDNVSLWAHLPEPGTVDYGDALAHTESYQLALGLQPGFDARRDGVDDYVHAAGGLAAAYHLVHEAPQFAYAARIEAATLALLLANDADPVAGTRNTSTALTLSAATAEGELRTYFSSVGVRGKTLPVFAAVWGGVYGGSMAFENKAGSTTRPYNIPFSMSVGAGAGRILPVSGRVILAYIENILRADGVVAAALPEAVNDKIMRMWVAHKNEIGYAQRVLLLMKILDGAGVLTGPLTPATAYKLERQVAALVFGPIVPRFSGSDTRVALRVSEALSSNSVPFTLAIELRSRHVFNVSLDSDLWLEPALGFGPRDVDATANTLPGNRRVSLLTADATAAAAAMPTGTLILDVPVNYTQVFYDSFYNTAGLMSLSCGATFGLQPNTKPGAAVTLGGAYTFFTSGVRGVKVGVNVGLGYVGGVFQQSAQIVASLIGGVGATYYVSPIAIGDAAPFDTSWLPRQ